MRIPFTKRKHDAKDIKAQKLTKKNISDVFNNWGYALSNKMQWHQMNNSIAWKYFLEVSIIYNAIDIITTQFASIPPRIKDIKEDRFLTQEDSRVNALKLLERLKQPEKDVTYNEYVRKMIPNYFVTGDLFQRLKAVNDKREPDELDVINSQDVNVDMEDREGKPSLYNVNFSQFNIPFSKDLKVSRFFNTNRTQELWHSKIFNPESKTNGLSPLNSLFYELEQFIASSKHNGNLLKKGARPSLHIAIPSEHDLSDTQYNRLKEQMKTFFQGEESAGNVLITQGGKEVKELSVSNKDMDFATLKQTVTEQSYRNLKIPMPLVLSDSMTLDNFKQALVVLYQTNILPLADIMFEEQNMFLMHRYDDPKRYKLTYNPKDIAALEPEFNNQVDRLIKTGLLTTNEGRGFIDLTDLEGEAGNQIFKPSSELPIGIVQEQKYSKEEYTNLLRKNGMSEDQIKDYAKKYYEKI